MPSCKTQPSGVNETANGGSGVVTGPVGGVGAYPFLPWFLEASATKESAGGNAYDTRTASHGRASPHHARNLSASTSKRR